MTIRLITRPVRRTPRDDYGDPDMAPAELDAEAELRDTFGDSALWLREHVPAALAAAGVAHTAVNALPWDKFAERLAGAAAPLAQTAERAASDAVSSLGVTGPRVPGDTRTGGAWNSSFPLARRAASERAAELVQQVTEEQRTRIADVIQRALAEGWDVPRTSRELRSGIGLTDAWASAVSNMYTGNLASGMDEARSGKLADQYYERLLTSRSTTIARTELLDASNQGRLAGWRQAANAGVFDPATATKRWIVGDSPCPECDGLDGEVTDWDGTFSSGDDMPPAHPRCRCTAVIENVERSSGDAAETLGPSEDDVESEPVAAMLMLKEWDESAHPRDEHGRFEGGGEAVSPADVKVGDRIFSTDQGPMLVEGPPAPAHMSHYGEYTAGQQFLYQNATTGYHGQMWRANDEPFIRMGDKSPEQAILTDAEKEVIGRDYRGMSKIEGLKFGRSLPQDLKGTKSSLTAYSRGGSVTSGISLTLRDPSQMSNYSEKQQESIKTWVGKIDTAMDKNVVPENIKVIRGTDWSPLLQNGEPLDPTKLEGAVYRDAGFLSVGVQDKSVEGFNRGLEWHLNVPEGTHGVWINDISTHPDQNEMLLDRNQRIYVSKVEPTNLGYRIHGTILPPSVKKSVDVDPVAAAVSILKAAGLVRKDWTEDAHPRDEHGKFIEGGEAISDPSQLQVGQTVTMTDGVGGPKVTGTVATVGVDGIKIIDANGSSHYGFKSEGAKIVLHDAHEETAKPTTGAGVKVGDKVTLDAGHTMTTENSPIHTGDQAIVSSKSPQGGAYVVTENGTNAFVPSLGEVTLHEPIGAAAPPVESPAPTGPGTVTPSAGGEPFKGGALEGKGPGKGVGELPKTQSGVKASSATSREAVKDHYAGKVGVERVAHLDDKRTAVELKDGRVIIYRNEGAKGTYASLGSKADMPKPTGVGKLPESQSKINASSAAGRQALKDYYANPGAHTLEHTSDTTSRITLSDGRVLDLRSENGKIYAKLDKSTLPTDKPGAAEESKPVSPTVASLQETLNQAAAQMGAGTLPEKGIAPLKVLPVGTQVKDPTGKHGYGVITSNPGLNDLNSTKVGVKWNDGVNGAISNSGNVEYTKVPVGYKFLSAADGGTLVPDISSKVSAGKPGAGPILQSAKLSGPESAKAQAALSSPIVANQPFGYASSVVTHENGQSFVYTKTGEGHYKVSAFDPKMVPKPSTSSFGGAGAQSYSQHDAAAHAATLYPGFTSPTSNSEGVQWANQHFGSSPKATSTELSKVKSYTGSGASVMNNQLRAGSTPQGAHVIDSMLAKNGMPADYVVHRGEPYSTYFTHAKLDKPEALKGSVIRDPGFKSTSTGSKSAFYTSPVQMHIAAPKGTPAAYIQNISSYPNEREVLLGRNLPMRVDDVIHAGKQYHVYVTVLPG